MKNGYGMFKRLSWFLISALLILSMLPAACSRTQAAGGKIIVVDNLVTASAVTQTGGQRDWRNYTQYKIFPSGYSGDFFVVFSFSNALHDKAVNAKANIFILSNGVIKDQKSKDVSLTDSTDNQLFWGDSFDISKYADGTYTVIVTVTDLLSATSSTIMNTFSVGETTK
jgi:hypothetical protein